MELALQVVGLKMTGKIEDAKNVAMRIVGNTGDDDSRSSGMDNMMQLSSASPPRDLRPLLLMQATESDDFERMIVKFLSILDAPLDVATPIGTSQALSHETVSGQTLLHLAAFLGFSSILKFLVDHDVDVDIRDRNGFTALHFAAFSKSRECIQILLDAGADNMIVNSAGKTAREISSDEHCVDLFESDTAVDSSCDDDDEAHWGDGEDDAVEHIRRDSRVVSRRPSRRTLRRPSRPPSRPMTPPPVSLLSDKKLALEREQEDEKQMAWFNMFQKALAQLPASPLPLPHWGGLPHLVFPVNVEMPNWPSFLGNVAPSVTDGMMPEKGDASRGGAVKAALELRNLWEKWLAAAVAATLRQQTELPPPEYTPRESDEVLPALQEEQPTTGDCNETPAAPESRPTHRPEYEAPPVVQQDVDAYTYQPRPQHKKREPIVFAVLPILMPTSDDRMLIYFWIPILFGEYLHFAV